MRKALFTSCFLIILSISQSLSSQELFYPEIEPVLTEEQKLQLEKAVKLLQKASGNENNANAIDQKYAKFEKKSNQSEWEEKTWEAKQERIFAENTYRLAYRMIFDVYSNIITNAKYDTKTDETKALTLNDDALAQFEDAEAKLVQFKDVPKEQLEVASYKELRSNLSEAHKLQVKGIRKQISALEIFIEKGEKTKTDKEDYLAWEQAKKDNTISSYHKYLDDHPRGKNMYDANSKIKELEKNLVNENDVVYTNLEISENGNHDLDNENNDIVNEKGLVFKVQIAASKIDLTDWFLNTKAPNAKKIDIFFNNNWNKYTVGAFNSYQKAAKYRNTISSTAPDAFIVVFKAGKQIQVTNEMKE